MGDNDEIKPATIDGKTRVPLALLVALGGSLLGAAVTYGGNVAAISQKVDEPQARAIAREEVAAAKPADRTDLAVLTQRVQALEAQVGKIADGQDKSLEILKDLARRQ